MLGDGQYSLVYIIVGQLSLVYIIVGWWPVFYGLYCTSRMVANILGCILLKGGGK